MVSEYLSLSRRSIECARADSCETLHGRRGKSAGNPEWPRIAVQLHDTEARRVDAQDIPIGPAAADTSESAAAGLRILVAEDNRSSQVIMKVFLESAGHQADIAASGTEVMAALDDHSYDLILMDLAMPGDSGIQICERIRQLQTNAREIPIIAVTAQVHDKSQEQCRQAGMNDFVPKPFDRDVLCEAINRCIRAVHPLKLSA